VSSHLTALEAHLDDYRKYFIVEKDDLDYTPEDHAKALAYRVLSSAALERYVEDLCIDVARIGITRILKNQPSATGRALIVWYLLRKTPRRAIPIHDSDVLQSFDLATDALNAFVSHARSSHGISGADFKSLVLAVGLRDSQFPDALVAQLDALADRRNPASHSYVNRAKTMEPPSAEAAVFAQILDDLRVFDQDLQSVAENYPMP